MFSLGESPMPQRNVAWNINKESARGLWFTCGPPTSWPMPIRGNPVLVITSNGKILCIVLFLLFYGLPLELYLFARIFCPEAPLRTKGECRGGTEAVQAKNEV